MPAILLIKDRSPVSPTGWVEMVIWDVDPTVRASSHNYKYRLAFIVDNICVVRYDNEAGKGDHKHIGQLEVPVTFVSIAQLLEDFWSDVNKFER